MARRSARAKKEDNTVAKRDDSAIIKGEEDLKEVAPERKDQYLKRLKKEDKEAAKAFEKDEEWLEIIGGKVLRKLRNKAGSAYTFYWFNAKKHPIEARKLKEGKGLKYGDPVEGKLRFIPLKFVDGRPVK